MGVPCLTVRENTERPITIEEGTNTLIGTSPTLSSRPPRTFSRMAAKGSHTGSLGRQGGAADRRRDRGAIRAKRLDGGDLSDGKQDQDRMRSFSSPIITARGERAGVSNLGTRTRLGARRP